jgi:hypothetical protein
MSSSLHRIKRVGHLFGIMNTHFWLSPYIFLHCFLLVSPHSPVVMKKSLPVTRAEGQPPRKRVRCEVPAKVHITRYRRLFDATESVTSLQEFWSDMIRPYLDPVTRARVRILSRSHREWDTNYRIERWLGFAIRQPGYETGSKILWDLIVHRLGNPKLGEPERRYLIPDQTEGSDPAIVFSWPDRGLVIKCYMHGDAFRTYIRIGLLTDDPHEYIARDESTFPVQSIRTLNDFCALIAVTRKGKT